MSKVWFCSDLHLGHSNITKFSGDLREGTNSEEHDAWIIEQLKENVHKRDVLWILGDVVFGGIGADGKSGKGIKALRRLKQEVPGQHMLILGNHDTMPVSMYSQFFHRVMGFTSYKDFWLSHSPIHPYELRGKRNIHGHVHHHTVKSTSPLCAGLTSEQVPIDPDYINVCVENVYKQLGRIVVSFDEIKEGFL